MNKVALVVAAHPDDEVLGCGATVATLAFSGWEVHHLILTNGADGRYAPELVETLRDCANRAAKVLGVRSVTFEDFKNQGLENESLSKIAASIEAVIGEIKPSVVFTQSRADLNLDHQIVAEATVTATRPLPNTCVERVYSYEVVSSSEWTFDGQRMFQAQKFFDVGLQFEKKLEAMKCYHTELREFPHPRSLEHLRNQSRVWGAKVGFEYAEAFEIIRDCAREF